MTLLVIIVVALMAMVLYLYFHRQREKTTAHQPYIEALIALLDSNEELAMRRLKEAVNLDSDLFDAYLRLGNLYRKRGDPARAMQIHQSLTARPTLKKHEEKKLYHALAQDALEAKRPNRSISFLKEILKIDNKDNDAYGMILRIYEDMGSYNDCIAVYEEGKFAAKNEYRRAFYYAMLAQSRLEKMTGEDRDAEKEIFGLLKKSLRIASDSITGTFALGKFFENTGDVRKARENYIKIINEHPEFAFLVIPHFERASFELGSFNDIIPIYEKIVSVNPGNFSVAFALANLYEKKNDIESAQELYGKMSEQFPRSILPKIKSLRLMTSDDVTAGRLQDIETSLDARAYSCGNCGNVRPDFVFLCEKCHAIESFSPSL
ncbi:MAG: tetratricopeptide repeat protein [candidate division WOR-3 bacterium]|nr:MAG: tetratricopeptide repeat protein [candidate division WOR-3 bacterium]